MGDRLTLTTAEFISKATLKHGGLYDYSFVDYQGCHSLVKIVCPEHGIFEQAAFQHLYGHGCQVCGGTALSDAASFITKAKKVHGEKYDYSKVIYVGNKIKVEIICPEHGSFFQSPNLHLKCRGCDACWQGRRGDALRFSTEEFVNKARTIHGDKYDYSLVIYRNQKQKIKIRCPQHGVFVQTGTGHIDQGAGCPDCAGKPRYTTAKFIKKARGIHGDRYDYSKTRYGKGNKEKVEIVCKKHGTFWQIPNGHLMGRGCSSCKESKGEKIIAWVLSKRGVKFVREKRFKNCRRVNPLSFDFFLPEHRTCIEFDGEQHFHAREAFGGEKGFVLNKEREQIKEAYCEENGIKLIRISFEEIAKIESILREAV